MKDELTTAWALIIVLITVWDFTWKGFALWRASRNRQPGWFVALMIVNSIGILPIIYLLTHKLDSKSE